MVLPRVGAGGVQHEQARHADRAAGLVINRQTLTIAESERGIAAGQSTQVKRFASYGFFAG